MASDQEINQRLRSLHQNFDFLLDNNVISTELYDSLTQQIPRRWNTNAAKVVPTAVPVSATSVTASSPPPSVNALTATMSNTSISSHKSPPPPPPVRQDTSPPPSYGLAQAEVLYDYKSNDEGDLNIFAGQRITILEYGKSSLPR